MSLTTTASLTLRTVLHGAADRAGLARGASGRGDAVTGLTPPAQALAAAVLAGAGPVVLVVPRDTDVEAMTEDARFFLTGLEGLSRAAAVQRVLPYPSREVDPYRGIAPHPGVASARAAALTALARGRARIVVASAAALLPRVSPPERLLQAVIELRVGGTQSPTDLADQLADAGFSRADPVEAHGEFCGRGGVVDLFPAGDAQPVRVEFAGDSIESIRRFDPSTQRSVAVLDQISAPPLRDQFEPAPAAAGVVDPDEDASGRGAFASDEAADPGLADDGAALDRGATFHDYVARCPGARFVVTEPDDVAALLRRAEAQVRASHAAAAARGEAAPPPSTFETGAADVAGWFAGARTFAALQVDDAPPGEDVPPGADAGPGEDALSGEDARPDADVPPGVGAPPGDTVRPAGAAPSAASPPGAGHAPRIAGPPPGGVRHVACQPTREFRGRLRDWVDEVRRGREQGDVQVLVAETAGRGERIAELLAGHDLVGLPIEAAEDTAAAAVLIAAGVVSRGFRLPDAGLRIFAETDLFEDEHLVRHQRSAAASFLSDFRDLKIGDPVVHLDHGVGTFVGLRRLAADEGAQEFMELRYAGGDKLFVPVEQLDLLQKYSGAAAPALNRLGGTTWQKAKTRVRKSMRDMAGELLRLYAARKALPGHACSPDTHWQREFEAAFEYEMTSDQESALAAIKRDMEAPSPMDRLLCGDVGYGKTEVALRAAFKALMDGKQVAFLTATTVLAFQHAETIRERFAAFPVRVAMLSRFVNRADQKAVLADLEAGKVDLVVGTHRLLSKDVRFHDFGLLIVDEEQRFGVAHKERIKQLRRGVDVLTLTATPIPRTLNMSIAGIRDMSVIETPPRDRLSIRTSVVRFDPQVIARAIRTEIERGGQVYAVHNRVESIHAIASLIGRLVPEARLAVAHGQTSEAALERVMIDFVAHKHDVLVATTIIENGLDIPNVNTIIVNHAEKYGLAQLYQLRGRVGRSDRRAYAYLVVPADEALTPIARRRLAAIREFSELGSGFRIAALDLEIRGAGNLLGAQQSGHIEAIGFDLYVKLLDQTVRELQGEEVQDRPRARVTLGVDLRIDEAYVAGTDQRLAIYRQVAAAVDEPALDAAIEAVGDRYGPIHPSVVRLAEFGRVRLRADRLGVEAIDREGARAAIRFGAEAPVDLARLVTFVQSRPGITLAPSGVVRLDLDAAADPRAGWSGPTPPAAIIGRGAKRDLDLLARVNAWLGELSAAG